MEMLPVAAFWVIAFIALRGDGRGLVYLLFASLSFGSFAVIPPALTGGLTFTPRAMTAVILCARVLLTPSALVFMRRSALDPRALGLLTTFWITAVIVTLFAPRLFAGQVEVIEMRSTLTLLRSVPLQPSTQNLSQLLYLTISVMTVFALAFVLKRPGWWTTILRGLSLGGAVAIVTGLMDMAGQASPLGALLAPFRTATYTLLTDVDIAGTKRVVGLMPEASAYGGLCVGLTAALHFIGRLTPDVRLRDTIRPLLVLGLMVMAMLSTSSAAYVGLAIFSGVAALEWGWRLLRANAAPTDVRRLGREAALGVAAIMGIALLTLANPQILTPAIEMVDRMVLQKTTSQSFEERSMWTAVSWQALWDTYGFGVGMGGTRASSSFVAIASNTGLVGAIFFYGFVLLHIFRPLPGGKSLASEAPAMARWTYLSSAITGLLASTGANFSVLAALSFAIWAATIPAYARPGRPPARPAYSPIRKDFARTGQSSRSG